MDVDANDNTASIPPTSGALGFDRLAQLLGRWQTRELHAARGFPECRGLSPAQLEDLYQDTALALLSRPYASEEHLRNALRHGIRHRALNMHRDQRRRREILAEHAPAMYRTAEAAQTPPEDAALAQQDRLIAKEFLSELDPLERQVFALAAEGLRYRAIATALSISVNEARTAARSCERKRARFQLLYEAGRLCGYRATTIDALQARAATGAIAEQASAHLAACPACAAARPAVSDRRLDSRVLAGLLAAGAQPAFRWLRRVSATSGVAAKASAVAVTAAVLAGSAVNTKSHRHGPATPPRSKLAPQPTRRPVAPSITRPVVVTRRVGRSSPARAPRRAASASHTGSPRVGTTVTSSVLVPRGASAWATEPAALVAKREFGPER